MLSVDMDKFNVFPLTGSDNGFKLKLINSPFLLQSKLSVIESVNSGPIKLPGISIL